jgi:hypothetical protein
VVAKLSIILILLLSGCESQQLGSGDDYDYREVRCEELPGQVVTLLDAETGQTDGTSVFLGARLGPRPPLGALGCFPRPAAWGTPPCGDYLEAPCAYPTASVPLANCELVREVYRLPGPEFVAKCGTLRDVDGVDDNVVVDVRYSRVLVPLE